MTTTDLILDAIAAYRLTKLATDDVVTAPIRDRIIKRAYRRRYGVSPPNFLRESPPPDPYELPTGRYDWTAMAIDDLDPPKLATLVTCRWCASVHIAFGIIVARRVAPRWWPPIARAFTYASAAALLARLED